MKITINTSIQGNWFRWVIKLRYNVHVYKYSLWKTGLNSIENANVMKIINALLNRTSQFSFEIGLGLANGPFCNNCMDLLLRMMRWKSENSPLVPSLKVVWIPHFSSEFWLNKNVSIVFPQFWNWTKIIENFVGKNFENNLLISYIIRGK